MKVSVRLFFLPAEQARRLAGGAAGGGTGAAFGSACGDDMPAAFAGGALDAGACDGAATSMAGAAARDIR